MNRKRRPPHDAQNQHHLLRFRKLRPPMLRASLRDRLRSSSSSADTSPPNEFRAHRLTTIRQLSLAVKLQILEELVPDAAHSVVEILIDGLLLELLEREEKES